MITGGSTLDPGFPTWGTMLREHGYHTCWYGKWHLTHRDNHWNACSGHGALERYGFAGGTYPSPDGGPGQGWHGRSADRRPVRGVVRAARAAASPGARRSRSSTRTTSRGGTAGATAFPPRPRRATVIARLPPNFETPELLIERHKPRLQRSLQDTAAASFGPVPFNGPEVESQLAAFLDLYVKLQLRGRPHVGARHARRSPADPEVAENTVVVFTSDHGEYGASHGLRGKGASAYEEAHPRAADRQGPRGVLTSASAQPRTQLTSSVDVAPLLLTIATGSDRRGATSRHYSHLAARLDLAAILADPQRRVAPTCCTPPTRS